MKSRKLLLSAFGLAALASQVSAQGWFFECIDPTNTTPYSTDFGTNGVGDSLIGFGIGVSGTVTMGGTAGPCFNPARTLNASGRFSWFAGNTGSVQTNFDNNMAFSFGAPNDPVGDFCYAAIYKDGAPVIFGDGGLSVVFSGLSQRYVKAVWRDADVEADLTVRVIGDAIRYDWLLRNLKTDPQTLALRLAAYVGERSQGTDVLGHNQANSRRGSASGIPRPTLVPGGSPYIGYIETPTVKPIRSEKSWLSTNPRFPEWVNFTWSQAQPYGVHIDNIPTDATPDATPADHMTIGNYTVAIFDNNLRGRVFTDAGQGEPGIDANIDALREDSDTPLTETAFIQTWSPQTVGAGTTREIIHYIRTPWSNGDYLDPYTVVVDAPRLVESQPATGLNGLSPNPMNVVAYIDNQYSQLDKEVPLTNVRIRIAFPAGSGLRLAAGESDEKILATVNPNQIRSVTWSVEADGTQVGYLPYTVTFNPVPGPAKTITGKVLVAAVPRLRLSEGPSLFTVPWNFADTSFDAIFGPVGDPDALKFGRDYLAYRWDPALNSYAPATTATRGDSIWIIPITDFGYRTLNGAQIPSDQANGGLDTVLQPGWNMIGNPYSIPIPLSQITAVGEADPTTSLTWDELVSNGWVSGSLAAWDKNVTDPTTGSYSFTAGNSALVQPQVGYWIYVSTFQPIHLQWPPVFTAGLSTSTRSAGNDTWRQSDNQWRLQLVARTANASDPENYVGLASSTTNANRLRAYKPPMAPGGKIELSIQDMVNGKPARLAQTLVDRMGAKTWTVLAKATETGDVTLNWPNVSTVPRNVRLTLVDKTTGTSRDLRFQSSYTFHADANTTREFELKMEPSGAVRAVIGNVSVARPDRSPNSPVTINYSLSTSAVTTVRILSGTGKEVFTISRGRASDAGENSATWNLRDNANRAVAPGTYQVEILAETSGGERVRKLVPVNIVR